MAVLYEMKLDWLDDGWGFCWGNKKTGMYWCNIGLRKFLKEFNIPRNVSKIWVVLHNTYSPSRQKMYLLREGVWEDSSHKDRFPSLSKSPNLVPFGEDYKHDKVISDYNLDKPMLRLLGKEDKKTVYLEVWYEEN